jgi:hypothetical protein
MINLNLTNVEELVFYDRKIQASLLDFSNLFNVWNFSLRAGLGPIGKKAVMDFLNDLKESHIEILEKYFNDTITVERSDYHIVRNQQVALDNAEVGLNLIQEFPNISIHRDENHLYLSYWR